MAFDVLPAPAGRIRFWSGRFPVLVIAHRGFSGAAPEDTLAAFKKAVDAGADVIELDVRFSKDGHLVVFHDDTLERTTQKEGAVAARTLEELRSLDAGSWFGPPFKGERIPTLSDVLEWVNGRTLLNIELKKGNHGPYSIFQLADRALDEVKHSGMADRVLFSSYDATAVGRILERDARLPVALITRDPWDAPLDAMGGRTFPALHCRRNTLNERNLLRARQQGVKIGVWTVNTEEEMETFVAMGVDAIITDYPDHLLGVLKKKFPKE